MFSKYPIFENENDTFVSLVIYKITFILISITAVWLSISLLLTEDIIPRFLIGLTTIFINILVRILIHIKKIKLSSYLLVISGWLVLSIGLIFLGGLNSSFFSAYILIIIIAGILLDRKSVFVVTLLCIVTGAFTLYLELVNMLPSTLIELDSTGKFISQSATLLMSILMIQIARTSLDESRNLSMELRDKKEDALIKLRESQEHFNQFASNINHTFWIFSIKDQKIVFINSIENLEIGLNDEDIQDSPEAFWELIKIVFYDYIYLLTEKKLDKINIDHFFELENDNREWLQTQIFPVIDEDDEIHRLVGITENITHRVLEEQKTREIEMQLLHVEKLTSIGILASSIAHEFKNFLAGILGYTDYLLFSIEEDNILYKEIIEIEKLVNKANIDVRKLLSFTRKQEFSPKIININKIILQLDSMIKRIVNDQIILDINLETNLGLVSSDRNGLEQVIINMVLNAKDAMPEGGNISITTRNKEFHVNYENLNINIPPGKYVQLSISDSGQGMTNEQKLHIFEPFYTTKAIGKGTGLGLATSHGIIEQSNGYIACDSKYGEGTIFSIYLPFATTKTPN